MWKNQANQLNMPKNYGIDISYYEGYNLDTHMYTVVLMIKIFN